MKERGNQKGKMQPIWWNPPTVEWVRERERERERCAVN